MTVEADRGAIGFGEKLLSLLAEGQFTATYKYAVILGLMDVCLEQSEISGAAPSSVTTRQLAEKVLDLYWPHAMPFRGGNVLRQNGGQQASLLTRIVDHRAAYGLLGGATVLQSARIEPTAHERLVGEVEWILVQMPLPRLQRIGGEVYEFFYSIAWDEHILRGHFRSHEFDNVIRFVGASADHLIRLAGLVRPLVQRQWSSLVCRLNRELVEDSELEDFLFGAPRVALGRVRNDLRELQDDRCFYCDRIFERPPDVDHFIPWARYPDNRIQNLVVAHSSCNSHKRDHMAAPEHVARWVQRMASQTRELSEIAEEHLWERHPSRSLSVGRSLYLRLPDDVRLWRSDQHFVSLNRGELYRALEVG